MSGPIDRREQSLSCFYYLKALPFSDVKIDGDFVRGVAGSPMDQLVVDAIIGIAKGMDRMTVAGFHAENEIPPLAREEWRRLRARLPRRPAAALE